MPEANGNGKAKWQLAFWIVSVFFAGGMLILTNNVVANDRIRQDEDRRIETNMAHLIDVGNNRYVQISGDLREIKAKMGIRSGTIHP